jgi:hypothetical protein
VLNPSLAPPNRTDCAFQYSPQSKQLYLFGGTLASMQVTNDLWSFNMGYFQVENHNNRVKKLVRDSPSRERHSSFNIDGLFFLQREYAYPGYRSRDYT